MNENKYIMAIWNCNARSGNANVVLTLPFTRRSSVLRDCLYKANRLRKASTE